jgi:chloride channel protein, CIC family
MLAVSVACVCLRKWSLYPAQLENKADSPTLREEARERGWLEPLTRLSAGDILVRPEIAAVVERTTVREMLELTKDLRQQKALAVVGSTGNPRGLVDIGALRLLSLDDLGWANAHDLMVPFAGVESGDDLVEVVRALSESGLPQIPVVEGGRIAGFVGEREVTRACVRQITAEGA